MKKCVKGIRKCVEEFHEVMQGIFSALEAVASALGPAYILKEVLVEEEKYREPGEVARWELYFPSMGRSPDEEMVLVYFYENGQADYSNYEEGGDEPSHVSWAAGAEKLLELMRQEAEELRLRSQEATMLLEPARSALASLAVGKE